LKEVDKQNWEYAHRLFQCVAAASRPLRADELAGFLAFDFEAGPIPTFLADWLPEDPTHTVLSTCSSLLAVVIVDGSPVLQFAHFSVKEYLTSARLAKERDTISRFHVSMTPAHTIVAQACLGILLDLDENITRDGLEHFPLVEYAAEHWVGHARFENVLSNVQDGMKRLFDPSKSHLSVWVWVYDPEHPWRRSERSERPAEARGTPLHYAAFYGLHDVVTFLIVEHSQDINARGFDDEKTPLHVALSRKHVHVARVLLEHGADTKAEDSEKRNPLHLASENGLVEAARFILERGTDTEARDTEDWSPLERASTSGHVDVVRLLLDHGADAKAQCKSKITPMHVTSLYGQVGVARVLLEHGADVKAQNKDNETPLHKANGKEVTRFLLEHGGDANAVDIKNQTPLHHMSDRGHVEAARVLLEHGVDVNARDANNATPLHLASSGSSYKPERLLDVVRLLLQYGSDIHARDDEGQTPFMKAAERNQRTMQLLLDNGAEDHRK
jgi:ankyrin repeat protein